MATRDGKNLPVIWVLIDVPSPRLAEHDQWLVEAEVEHRRRVPDAGLGVNLSADGTRALIKVAGVMPAWVEGQPWSGLVRRVYTETDHGKAVALVRSEAWIGPVA